VGGYELSSLLSKALPHHSAHGFRKNYSRLSHAKKTQISDKSLLTDLDNEQRKKIKQRHLAQGAPTSPTLSNLVMYKLDKRLDRLANSLELNYSRYADDLAFSGNEHRDWRFFEPLIASICLEERFKLNHRDRRYFDQIKAILTNCIRHGVESQNITGHHNFQSHLLGQVIFVNSLNKSRGEKLLKLYQKIKFA